MPQGIVPEGRIVAFMSSLFWGAQMDILSNLLMPLTRLNRRRHIRRHLYRRHQGLSVTMAVSILISFTFSWDAYPALAPMIGIYMGGVYGGSRTAILLNTTGAPSAISSELDGLPLAWQGRTGEAIGTIMGALPGTDGDIASLMAYDHAKRVTRNPAPPPFGQGAVEGPVATKTANNAAVGGAFIPMMTLGIPSDAVTAIMIGALFIHGLNPGPMLMIEQPHMLWFIVGSPALANCFMLIFGLTGIRLFVKIVELPRTILLPVIMVLSIVGAYAINNSVTNVYWMLGFGVSGYCMRLYGCPLAPVILGVILSRLLDDNWRRAIISEREDFGAMMQGVVTSPLSLFLLVAVVLILVTNTPIWARWRARKG
ncbi:tripartite tricarboxylate transporter permease [Paracoccus sp. R86501]|uniref:tripartite tricarboxylate transporter permease n=1 Tax=Paracoccus sp. R86501 TaxID=3101711 RepID=UPI003672BCA4